MAELDPSRTATERGVSAVFDTALGSAPFASNDAKSSSSLTAKL